MTQTCDLRDGLRIKFVSSGIEVMPYEMSIQNGVGQNSSVRTKLSRPAGELIDEDAERWEPVEVYVGGILQDTYIYPRDGMTLGREHETDTPEQSWLQLDGVGTILSQGIVNGRFDKITLEDVVQEIYDSSDKVKTAIDGISVEDGDRTERRMGRIDKIRDRSIIGIRRNLLQGAEGGFHFDKLTPQQALNEVSETFGVTYGVNRENVLVVGSAEFISQSNRHYISGRSDVDYFKLREYTVSKTGSRIGRIVLNGKLKRHRQSVDGFTYSAHVMPVAEAWIPGSEGEELAIQQDFEIEDPGMLEDRAQSILLSQLTNHKFGNIVFNSGSSTQTGQAELAEIQPGDVFIVEPSQEEICGQRVHGGIFSANSVQHKMNERVGWETIVSVSLLPQQMESKAVLYDPNRDQEYDSVNDALYNS